MRQKNKMAKICVKFRPYFQKLNLPKISSLALHYTQHPGSQFRPLAAFKLVLSSGSPPSSWPVPRHTPAAFMPQAGMSGKQRDIALAELSQML
jgi:hypothetical protein